MRLIISILHVMSVMALISSVLSLALYLSDQFTKKVRFKDYSGVVLIFSLPLLLHFLFFFDPKTEYWHNNDSFPVTFFILIIVFCLYYVYSGWKNIKEKLAASARQQK